MWRTHTLFWRGSQAVSSSRTQPSRRSVELLASGCGVSQQHKRFLLSKYCVSESTPESYRIFFSSSKAEIAWLSSFSACNADVKRLYLCLSPKAAEGASCLWTQPLRGTGTLPSWGRGVPSRAASACVTCASGSSCTAPTGWERWRWSRLCCVSINYSNGFCFLSPGIKLPNIFLCNSPPDDPSQSTWRLHFVFVRNVCPVFLQPLALFHVAHRQSPDAHRKEWKCPCQEIIHQPYKLY